MGAQQFNGRISVILYKEDNIYYAYCEALDIIGYGNDEDEARQSFEIILDEILNYDVPTGAALPIPIGVIKTNLRTMGCTPKDLIDYMAQ